MRQVLVVVLAACVMAGGVWAQEKELAPFVVRWTGDGVFPVDLTGLQGDVAGKEGFVQVVDGHLARGDGKRLKIWGINATGRATLPAKTDAPIIAAKLARMGINCVRFHFLDRVAPAGLIAAGRDDTRALDPAQLDKLDFFIAELKKRGVYSDLNLNVGRTYKAGDGVKDYELLGFAKSLTWFDERLIEMQKEYAKQLLTHRNSYTGNEYRSEPAVAIVEFVNENSLVEAWFGGRLLGKHTTKNPGTWTDIPESYAKALTEKYNAWLSTGANLSKEELAKVRAGVGEGELVPRLRPEEFGKAGRERFHAEANFYMAVERDFVDDMRKFLREELGVKALLVANSDHGHHKTGYPQLMSISRLDVVDSHVYWQHPRYLTDLSGKRAGFDIPNTPMVDDPLQSTVVQLSRSAFAGKPFTVSEVNHPFPAEYACEGIPILAAYAAHQDWDGVFWYTLGHDDIVPAKPQMKGHFDLFCDPVKMAQLPAGALMFLRGDVKAADQTIERSYTRDQVIEGIRLPYNERPYFTPTLPLSLPLEHAMRIKSLDGPPTGTFGRLSTSPITSDTKELTWHFGPKRTGLVTVDTLRSQALIGFVGSRKISTKHLEAEVDNDFCALTLSSLDGKPIASSRTLLLTATGRMANTAQKWNDKRTSLENWGTEPTRIEVISGKVIMRGIDAAKGVEARPLDGAARPVGQSIATVQTAEGWSLPLGKMTTTSYVVMVDR